MKIEDKGNYWQLTGINECDSCKGTGLYQGIGERDGAFVICNKCNGTGSLQINLIFIKFSGRKKQERCKRVYSNGMGYYITDKDIEDMPFSVYGCAYEEWLKGAKTKPLDFLGCPYQETNQRLQNDDVNNLYKYRCKNNLGFAKISKCLLYKDKRKCWEIYNGSR